jgi:hypothetical protein
MTALSESDNTLRGGAPISSPAAAISPHGLPGGALNRTVAQGGGSYPFRGSSSCLGALVCAVARRPVRRVPNAPLADVPLPCPAQPWPHCRGDEAEVFRLLAPLTPDEVEALAPLIESAVMDICNCLSVFVAESSHVSANMHHAPPSAERQGSKKRLVAKLLLLDALKPSQNRPCTFQNICCLL